jgi:hypothetical protein
VRALSTNPVLCVRRARRGEIQLLGASSFATEMHVFDRGEDDYEDACAVRGFHSMEPTRAMDFWHVFQRMIRFIAVLVRKMTKGNPPITFLCNRWIKQERRAWNPHQPRCFHAKIQEISLCVARSSRCIKPITWHHHMRVDRAALLP